MVTAAIAVSFLVVIIAVAVSAGFRHEIRTGLSGINGDVQLTMADMNYVDESSPISVDQSYMPYVKSVKGVRSVDPVVWRAGIVKNAEDIYGIMVKGVEGGVARVTGCAVPDTLSLAVALPSSFAEMSGLSVGDKMLTYFIGDKVKARQFTVASIYEPLVRTDDRFLVYADISDMQRLNGWSEDQASMFEVILDDDHKTEESMQAAAREISDVIYENCSEEDDMLWAVSAVDSFPQIFEWMSLIDFNVLFVLMLMIAVAGVNMITGLLIMLFENISTIGLLKALGMRNIDIINVFITRAAGTVFKGMLIGNVLALLFCLIQSSTHFIALDPVNYFVSYVPIHVDLMQILMADAVAFVSIILLLALPSLFVLRVDPAKTVKMD
jgi:lipoprotein-releasing system permease protein